MGLRTKLGHALKDAMKNQEAERLSTLRLINAAIKDRDIAARYGTEGDGVSEDEIVGILATMVKQRQESARVYEEGGRLDLAERELGEIKVIEAFLPKPLSEDEVEAAIGQAIADTGAGSIKDMGRVMGALKADYTGRMDFGSVGPMVKARLG
ncbi:MAG: GatB/YqeY domain-containing protein [Pseudomonadota bacterium]